MAREFKLPDIGEGVHEGEVVKWFVKEGDPIRENDPVVEVMTDKVTVQIPSPVTGKVLQLRAKEGEVVKVGATLVVFGEAGEAAPTNPATAGRPTNVTAAHFTYVEEVDMSQLVHLRDHLKEAAERKGLKLTFLPFFIKSILGALKEFPTLNASVDDERGEIVLKKYFHIGIATATDEGLIVTVVHDADKKDLWGLAKELERLSNAAREKRLALEDVLGSTFTITSLGKEGGILATPIINWPEVAILGVHKIEKRPVVRNDQVVIRDMMYLSCSFDHRVIDGHVGD